MAKSETRDWVLIQVEDLHRRVESTRFWEEEKDRIDLKKFCLILSYSLWEVRPTVHTACRSGMPIDTSRYFSVKQAGLPCL